MVESIVHILGPVSSQGCLMDVLKDSGFFKLVNAAIQSEVAIIRSECEEKLQAAYNNFQKDLQNCLEIMEYRCKDSICSAVTKVSTELRDQSSQPEVGGGKCDQPEEMSCNINVVASSNNQMHVEEFQEVKPHKGSTHESATSTQESTQEPVSADDNNGKRRSVLESLALHTIKGASRKKLFDIGPSLDTVSIVPTTATATAASPLSSPERHLSKPKPAKQLSTRLKWMAGQKLKAFNSLLTSKAEKRQTFQEMLSSIATDPSVAIPAAMDPETMSRLSRRDLMLLRRQTISSRRRTNSTPKASMTSDLDELTTPRPKSPFSSLKYFADAAMNNDSWVFRESVMSGTRRESDASSEEEAPPASCLQDIVEHIDVLCHGLVMDEHSDFRKFYDMLIFSSVIYCCFSVPYQLAFIYPRHLQHFPLTMSIWNDFVLNLGVLLNFFTAFRDKDGIIQWNLSAIARNYVTTWLLLDATGSIPFDRVIYAFVDQHADWPMFLRLVRIVTLFKFNRRFKKIERNLTTPFSLRFFRAALAIAIVVHWFTCLAYVVSKNTDNANTWIGVEDFSNKDYFFKYVRLIYWVSISMIGGNTNPNNTWQTLCTLLVFWCGLLMYFFVFNNIVTIMTNMNTQRIEYNKSRDRHLTHMKHLMLPPGLRLRILDHFEEAHAVTRGVNTQEFMQKLPYHLRQEVAFHISEKTLDLFPMFNSSPLPFLSAVIMRVELTVCSEGSILCIEGDLGDDMFFVISGKLEVFKKGVGQVRTLREGSVFGERMMVMDHGRRTATVKAITSCTLYSLHKDRFAEIESAYPDECVVFFQHGRKHSNR